MHNSELKINDYSFPTLNFKSFNFLQEVGINTVNIDDDIFEQPYDISNLLTDSACLIASVGILSSLSATALIGGGALVASVAVMGALGYLDVNNDAEIEI